jgi:hypothetical protein
VIFPLTFWREVLQTIGIERIDNLIVFLRPLAARQQQRFLSAVVQEGMRDARPGRERREIAGDHREDVAVHPRLDRSLEHVDELFFVRLRVRQGDALARWHPLEV